MTNYRILNFIQDAVVLLFGEILSISDESYMKFLHLQHDVSAKGTALWQTKTDYRKIAFVAYIATACLLFLRRCYVSGSASRM